MSTDQLWDVVKSNLTKQQNVGRDVYSRYIEPAKLIEINSSTYYLIVKFNVAKAIIKDILPLISSLIETQTQTKNTVTILNEEEYQKRKKEEYKDQKSDDLELSFKGFIVGPSNKEAFQAATAVCKKLGKIFNPLFIYANSGLGKTHLLKAINHEVTQKQPKLNVLYLTSEQFGNEVVEVLQKGYTEIEKFKDNLKSADILLIDDIQFLAKKEKTNEIFFSIFNEFVEHNKQIVITSDKSPEELNGFDQRMITRFNSGLNVKIEIPDSDTAVSIIEKELQVSEEKSNLTKDAITYLATYFASDVRKIKGSINRLVFTKMTSDNEVFTLEDIEDIFKGIPSSSLGKLNTMKIKETVANQFGVSIKLIDGKTRTADVIKARHVAMYLTKTILNKPFTQIGVDFGGKDHTTVMNAVNKIEKLLQKDRSFNKIIEKMRVTIIDK